VNEDIPVFKENMLKPVMMLESNTVAAAERQKLS